MDLRNLFTPEAGQARRAWIDGVGQRLDDGMDHYLGPTGIPSRIRGLADLFQTFSPAADVADAYDASGRLMRARSVPEGALAGAGMASALASLFVPGNQRAIAQGVDGLGTAARRFGADQSGSAGRAGGGETPAQEVARLLREGRAGDVTDEMMARVDPQEMHRLYETGATGQAMPMDEASRMARAREMNLTEPAFHGSDTDISAFDFIPASGNPGVYTSGDPSIADVYARRRYDLGEGGAPNYIPTLQNPEATTRMARGGDYRVTYDPTQIRSRFARFDPRLGHLRNLSAGAAGLGLTGLFMGEPTQ